MINWTLFKKGVKDNWKVVIILSAVITMYFTIIISMFDPRFGSVLSELAEKMPALMAMVGMNPVDTTLIGFMAAYLYGFIMLIFPMIFSIICAHNLIAKQVERGSMTYLLAAPIKRWKVVYTQMKVLGSGILFIVLYATILGIVVCEAFFPKELEIGKFLLLNLGVLCLQLFIGSICFMFSCIFSDTKYSIGFGAGIPALGFIIQMMSNVGTKLEIVKYATFFTLFNPNAIILNEPSVPLHLSILFIASLLLYGVGIVIFTSKDLHI